VEVELLAGGFEDVARYYSLKSAPGIIESVQRLSASRRCLYRLVRSESALVDALVDLSGLGSVPAKQQAKMLAAFRKKWQFQLRRLYPGVDFSAISQPILEAATQALLSFNDSRSGADSDVNLVVASESGPGVL